VAGARGMVRRVLPGVLLRAGSRTADGGRRPVAVARSGCRADDLADLRPRLLTAADAGWYRGQDTGHLIGSRMSTFVPSTIACRCGTRYDVEVANGLHISLRPDLRQKILDGTFHRFFCPSCGMTTMVDATMSFTDFPRRQWFTIAPGNGLPWRRTWLDLARDSFQAT